MEISRSLEKRKIQKKIELFRSYSIDLLLFSQYERSKTRKFDENLEKSPMFAVFNRLETVML